MTLSRCASDGVTSQGFSSFILACNENSGHFIIVLSKGSLCFVTRALALAVLVYRCGLCLRKILVVDLSIGGWRLVTLLVLTRCAWCRFGGIVCLTRCRLGWYSQRSYRTIWHCSPLDFIRSEQLLHGSQKKFIARTSHFFTDNAIFRAFWNSKIL